MIQALERIAEVVNFIVFPKKLMEQSDKHQDLAREKLSNTLKEGTLSEKEDPVTNIGDSAMKALLEGFLNNDG